MPTTKSKPETRTERIWTRITPTSADQIADLAARWGGIRPLSHADVLIEAVRRAWEAEQAKERG